MPKRFSPPSRNFERVTGASLVEGAATVLACADADEKACVARQVADAWRASALTLLPADNAIAMPQRPARPATPALLAPRNMPRRTFKGTRGRIALLHSLAHIELNAIDLAFDLVGRFADAGLPRKFFDDWVSVGDETRHDLMARLAVVPLVLEARGLDVTPGMIERLEAADDAESAAVLRAIYRDEQDHVRAGAVWFAHLCRERNIDPRDTFQMLVRRHFRGTLKPPFNETARRAAGLEPDFYGPLAEIRSDEPSMVN